MSSHLNFLNLELEKNDAELNFNSPSLILPRVTETNQMLFLQIRNATLRLTEENEQEQAYVCSSLIAQFLFCFFFFSAKSWSARDIDVSGSME